MGKLPVLKPREVAARLESLGFAEIRQRGSHKQYRHADGRGTTIPLHAGRDISPTLLRKIAKDIGLTVEQLLGRSLAAAELADGADVASFVREHPIMTDTASVKIRALRKAGHAAQFQWLAALGGMK